MKRLIVIFILVFLVVIISCKSSTEPEQTKPGRRDYTWTADTLNTKPESIILVSAWGSTPNDIWTATNGSAIMGLWHFDGTKWTTDLADRLISPWCIWGNNKYDIWMGNGNSTIWHFDGSKWEKHSELSIKGYDNIFIVGIYGTAYNNMWCTGYAINYSTNKSQGVLARFRGSAWEIVNIPETNYAFVQIYIDDKTQNIILSGYVIENYQFIYKAFRWNGSDLKEIMSSTEDVFLSRMNKTIYLVTNKKIYKYNNSNVEFWKDFPNTNYAGGIIGRTETDFFGIAYDGMGHYNGTDFVTVYKTDSWTSNVLIFDEDVFFLQNNVYNGKNIIIHGKLK